jgi:hypothetical protein
VHDGGTPRLLDAPRHRATHASVRGSIASIKRRLLRCPPRNPITFWIPGGPQDQMEVIDGQVARRCSEVQITGGRGQVLQFAPGTPIDPAIVATDHRGWDTIW